MRDHPNIEALEDAGLLSRHAGQEETTVSQGDAQEDEESSSID